jgi:hypothetical protein
MNKSVFCKISWLSAVRDTVVYGNVLQIRETGFASSFLNFKNWRRTLDLTKTTIQSHNLIHFFRGTVSLKIFYAAPASPGWKEGIASDQA